ncbi:MAG: ATP-binding protein [Bacteroidales bacterium]|nr:ATP-binding protein [Bacteroidales bacterium]
MKDLSKINDDFSELNEKMQLVCSVAHAGFWEYRKDSKKIILSDEACEIIGLEQQNELSFIRFLKMLFDIEKADLIYQQFKKNIQEYKNINIVFSFTRLNDYRKTTVKVVAKNLKSTIKQKRILGIVQDITEQETSKEQLKKAKDKAEEADLLKSAFLANMSHEIRTPLNAIVGFSKLLSNPAISNKQRQEYSEYIAHSAENLLNLIQDIVDVSKIEAGKIHIRKETCFVNKTLIELKTTFEKEKLNKNKEHIDIKLKTYIEDEHFAIKTDNFRLIQIFSNLLGNALKFIEKGSIEFGYIIPGKKYIQFYVKDTGIGIPIDKRELIFSRFGQIVDKKIKNPGGTGLGLSITKQLVEKLGGKIWYESELNKGTTFYFTLPFDKIEGEIPVKKDENFELNIQKELNILAVEDDKLNMILLKDLLSVNSDKIKIDEAVNGREALKLLKNKSYDLIIMDVRMPEMDGYEATKYIREKFPEPINKIPILGLSANAVKEEIEKGKLAGMNNLLAKPVKPENLIAAIQKLTGNKSVTFQNTKIDTLSSENKIVSVDFFKHLFKNDKKRINKTINAYLKEIPVQLKNLSSYLKENDFENLKITAHSLKSTFRYIGREDLSRIAKIIEINSDNNTHDKQEIENKITQLSDNWKFIEIELKKMLIK